MPRERAGASVQLGAGFVWFSTATSPLHYVSGSGEDAAEREAAEREAERRNPPGITSFGRRQRLQSCVRLTQRAAAEPSLSFLLTLVQLEGGVGHGVEYLLSLQYVDVP